MADGEKKTMVGVCSEVSEKNGWTTFLVDAPGSKYPTRLSTKLPAVIEQGRAFSGQSAEWEFNEVESDKLNENTGKPYVNRYLNKVSAPTGGTQAQQGSSSSHQPMQGGDKDRAITRMACLKAACELYGGTGNTEEAIKAAARLEVWVMRDIDDLPFEGASAATGAPVSAPEQSQGDHTYPEGQMPPDSDIPF